MTSSPAVIRQWAREHGMTVGDRGRLSPQVLDAYAAANSKPTNAAKPERASETPQATASGLRISAAPRIGSGGPGRTVKARAHKPSSRGRAAD